VAGAGGERQREHSDETDEVPWHRREMGSQATGARPVAAWSHGRPTADGRPPYLVTS
jgi:hypothetical protein